jgi:uncharacterized membrane protein YhaH (DUF805 family)
MLTPERVLRLTIEVIFILLGVLVVWLGLTGRIFFDRRRPAWFILSAVLILWGLRALFSGKKWWASWESWTRGLSLTLLGAVMLLISRAPFEWVGVLIAAGGILLALRGIFGSVLIFRPR